MMMFGTGPYISIPFCLAATSPPGPQAMAGYFLASVGCFADSFIWGELGSRFPYSGGSYIYLRECFGAGTWGDLAAFIYLWQSWVSNPAQIASGFIAISEYLVYIHGRSDYWTKSLTAMCATLLATLMLLRRATDTGCVVYVLWAITLASMAFVLVSGFLHFDADNLQLPPNPWGDPATTSPMVFIYSLGAACRFGVYDFTGYCARTAIYTLCAQLVHFDPALILRLHALVPPWDATSLALPALPCLRCIACVACLRCIACLAALPASRCLPCVAFRAASR